MVNAAADHRTRQFLSLHRRVFTRHPLSKMAIGLGGKDESEKSANGGFGSDGYYNGFTPDAEKQAVGGPRKMSRIDRPITGSIADMQDGRKASLDGSGDDIHIGAQIEMEAGNAIKYRTCSWQKV